MKLCSPVRTKKAKYYIPGHQVSDTGVCKSRGPPTPDDSLTRPDSTSVSRPRPRFSTVAFVTGGKSDVSQISGIEASAKFAGSQLASHQYIFKKEMSKGLSSRAKVICSTENYRLGAYDPSPSDPPG